MQFIIGGVSRHFHTGGRGGGVFLERKIEFQSNMFYEKSEDETKFGVKKNDKGEIVNIILQHVLTSL